MGSIVSIWSPAKKTGKSLFLYILTRHLNAMLSKNNKVLSACINFNYGNLNGMFNIGEKELNLEDIINFKIHPDNRLDMLKVLARRENIYFVGSRKMSISYANRNIKIFESLLEEFRDTFDLVLIDTISGCENSLTNMVIDKSDCVLNVINQDKELLDRNQFITNRDIAYIVNQYRPIYPDVKDMAALYKIKDIFTLPLCDELQQMKNRDKLEFYCHYDTEYNRVVREIAEYMAQNLRLEMDRQTDGEEKRKRGRISEWLGALAGS